VRILVQSAPGVTTTSFTKHGEPDMAAKRSSLERGIFYHNSTQRKEKGVIAKQAFIFQTLF